MLLAFSWSSQRSGREACVSSSAARARLPSMSKILLYLLQPFSYLHELSAVVAQQLALLVLYQGYPVLRPLLRQPQARHEPQQNLYFFPLPQGQGAFLPTFWERAASGFFLPPSPPLPSTTRREGRSSAFTTWMWNM